MELRVPDIDGLTVTWRFWLEEAEGGGTRLTIVETVEIPHPTIGSLRLAGIPIKYSETPGSIDQAPPRLGEHTDAVLADVLGYSPDRIEALRRTGAI